MNKEEILKQEIVIAALQFYSVHAESKHEAYAMQLQDACDKFKRYLKDTYSIF